MDHEPLHLPPGTTVVDLGALGVSASVASGAVAGAWIQWWVNGGWAALGGLVVGALLGLVVGRVWAQARYRRHDDTTIVVAGRASLALSIPAALIGALATTLLIALLGTVFAGTAGQTAALFAIAVGCAAVVGVAFACLVSLG